MRSAVGESSLFWRPGFDSAPEGPKAGARLVHSLDAEWRGGKVTPGPFAETGFWSPHLRGGEATLLKASKCDVYGGCRHFPPGYVFKFLYDRCRVGLFAQPQSRKEHVMFEFTENRLAHVSLRRWENDTLALLVLSLATLRAEPPDRFNPLYSGPRSGTRSGRAGFVSYVCTSLESPRIAE